MYISLLPVVILIETHPFWHPSTTNTNTTIYQKAKSLES